MVNEYASYPFWDHNLPLNERVADLVSRLTIEEKIALIPTRQAAVRRLGIPAYSVGGEAAHGVAWKGEATVFPQPIGLACTWDTELMKRIGSAIGDEARVFYQKDPAQHGLTLWAPTVDLERDPRWGRTEEGYGEDPHLTGKMTSSLIQGMQGEHPFYLKMVATLKHFFANNNEVDRLSFSSTVDPRNRMEYYLKAFEMPFREGGAYSMMTAYNSINGTPAIESPYVNEFVKEEWQMPGFIVCDGADLSQTVDYHHYHTTHAESAAGALRAGVDCLTDETELVIDAVREALEKELISEKDLDRALHNIFRVRIKLGQFDPAHLNPYADVPEQVLMSQKHSQLSYEAAQKSIVLLKNEDSLLPLNKESIQELAIVGPLADEIHVDWYSGTLPYSVSAYEGMVKKLEGKKVHLHHGDDLVKLKNAANGWVVSTNAHVEEPLLMKPGIEQSSHGLFRHRDWGYGSHTLQSAASDRYVNVDDTLTVRASSSRIHGWFVKEVFDVMPVEDNKIVLKTWNGCYVTQHVDENGDIVLRGEESARFESATIFDREVVQDGIEQAVEAAKKSDVAVVVVGNHPFINGKEEVDRPGLELPPAQVQLIKEVCQANPKTIVVITGSYPFALGEVAEIAPAIVYSAHGGQELGNALADVIFGEVNPAGRLNMTWYKNEGQLSTDILDYDIMKGNRTYMYFEDQPLYPFGYGLSYTTFQYQHLQLDKEQYQLQDTIKLSIEVCNSGQAAGEEVVQLYYRAEESRVRRPRKQLIGFKRIYLEAGACEKLTFDIPVSELSFWDVTREKACVEKGRYTFMIGGSSETIGQSASIEVAGDIIPERDLSQWTYAENYDDYNGIVLAEYKQIDETGFMKLGRPAITSGAPGSWVAYHNIKQARASRLEAIVHAGISGGRIEVGGEASDGLLIGQLELEGTADVTWQHIQIKLSQDISGSSLVLQLEGSVKISKFLLA